MLKYFSRSLSWIQSVTLLLFFMSLFGAASIQADTDDADSLDFESFHQNDAYHQSKTIAKDKILSQRIQSVSVEIEQDSAEHLMAAIYALHKKMNLYCSKGWVKTQESLQHLESGDRINFSFYCQ
jgi:hypothetical protein